MVVQVLEDQVDFAVGDPGETVPQGIRVEEIHRSPRVLIVAKGDALLLPRPPLRASQLGDRDWIVLPGYSLMRRKLNALLGDYRIAMEVEQWDVMKTYVALGMGIGMLPEICIVPQDRRRLRVVPLNQEFGSNRFGIILRKKKVLSPAALALIDVIKPGLARRLAK
jgi:DNA-binding transcriptional LysR family regulator